MEKAPAPVASHREVPLVSADRARRLGLTRRLPSDYRAVCAEQAAVAPAGARTCPPLIPTGRLDVLAAAPFSKRDRYRGGYVADFSSGSLAELHDRRIDSNGGHWHYDVSWTPAVTRLSVDSVIQPVNASRRSACRPARLGEHRITVCRVVPYEDGGGLSGGHIAYLWSRGGTTFVISLHGYGNEPRARAMMAALLRRVVEEPRSAAR